MSTLLEISDDMAALDRLLEESAVEGGDITAVEAQLESWFKELSEKSADKVDGYCALIRELELRSAARKEESERLLKRAKIDASQCDFLTARLKQFFIERGLKKMQTRRYVVSVVNNGGKLPMDLDVNDPEKLPPTYVKQVPEIDRDKIRAELESGKALPFARLGTRGNRLSIK